MAKKTLLLAFVAWCCCTSLAWAASGVAGAGAGGDLAGKFYVREIQVDGSEILAAEEIHGVLSKYEGRTVDFSDLESAVAELNDLYARKNYVTAKAVLPPQTVDRGVVKIRLVEGHIGQVLVAGNDYTSDAFILRRVTLKPGQLVQLQSLEEQVAHFNGVNDVQLQAELKPGKAFGTTDVVLRTEEPHREQLSLFTDNGGRSETGAIRNGLTLALNSLSRGRDVLTLSELISSGSSTKTFAVDLPYDLKGSRVRLGYDASQVKVIGGDYESLDISGNSSDLHLSVNSPVVVKPELKVYRSAEVHAKESGSYIAGDFNYITTRLKTVVFGLSAQRAGDRSAWQGEIDLTAGTASPASYKEPDLVGRLFKCNGSFTWERLVRSGAPFTVRLTGQWGRSALPSSEQFSLGGMATVRGSKEGVLTGDGGYLLTLEQGFRLSKQSQGFIFVDHGGVFPFKGNDEPVNDRDYLTSAGLGISGNVTKHLSAKVIYGRLLGPAGGESVHFLVQETL